MGEETGGIEYSYDEIGDVTVDGVPVDELYTEEYNAPKLCYISKVQTTIIENMTKQEELDCLAKASAGDKKSQAMMLDKYERLCHKLARKFAFTAPSHQHEDLVQEGRIGLLQAIKTFDPTNGASFMTWAFYHVRGAVAGCGRVDRRQPKYPYSVEDCPRAYNIEDPTQEVVVRDTVTTETVKQIIAECCGGLHTKRASIVMDRYGLLGRKELRNCEAAEKYGLTKYAINSHTYSFKKKARERFPHLANFV